MGKLLLPLAGSMGSAGDDEDFAAVATELKQLCEEVLACRALGASYAATRALLRALPEQDAQEEVTNVEGDAVASEGLQVDSRESGRFASSLQEGDASTCSCGQVFMPDAMYCRQCGKPRGGNITVTKQDAKPKAAKEEASARSEEGDQAK